MKTNGKLSLVLRGILKENPVLVLVLGTCPTLAMTTSVKSALGMGLAALFVLVCSNTVISALRKCIPDTVRIPAYIVIIACFVTVVKMLLHAYMPDLYAALGTFLDLIVVNCIILGRAEMFASKNGVLDSALDGLGMGLGFTCTLFVMATVREVFGNGSFFGIEIPVLSAYRIPILIKTAGGFFVFGALMALTVFLSHGKAPKKKEFSCDGCPSAGVCLGRCAADTTKEEDI